MTALGKALCVVGLVAVASCTKPVMPSRIETCPPQAVVWVICPHSPDLATTCRVRDGVIGCGLDRLVVDYANERMARPTDRSGRFTLIAVKVTAQGAGPADQSMMPESSYRPDDL